MSHLVTNGALEGVVHLWGHSWEIDRMQLWTQLDDALSILSELPGARFMTNREAYRRDAP